MDRPFEATDLLERSISFAGRPLPCLPYPLELDPDSLSAVSRAVRAVWTAAEAVTDAFLEDASLREVFGYGPLQEAAVAAEPGYRPHIPLGRMDLFLVDGVPKVMEFNTDGTAGWHYTAALTSLWRERTGLPPEDLPLPKRLLETLLTCFRRWDREGVERPTVAIVDWEEVGTRSEQSALAARFTSRGVPTSLEDPRSLRLEGGRLVGPRGRIHLAYRRLVSEEAFQRPREIAPFLEACASGAACVVGSFRTDPGWSKTLLAVLSDPSLSAPLPAPVREAVANHIPWTRLVRDGEAEFGGTRRDLRSLLLRERESFVLKPARSYEGRGLVAGPYASLDEWASAVERAFFRPGTWVVQEFLRPGAKEFPDGVRRCLQPGAYVLEGRLAGFLGRASETEVIAPGYRDWYLPSAVQIP